MLRVTLIEEAEPAPASSEPATTRRFGDYELVRELGRGGMGVVYEARHLGLHRTVALKMLHPSRLSSPAQLQRFRQEAEAVAALDHPHILPVYEVGSVQGQPYFTMKLAEAGDLATVIASFKAEATHRAAATLLAATARAVHYAHQRGIQHRDLKPHNILLDAEGRPYVGDFGLAKFVHADSGLTLSTDVIGSPAYMSPEQAAGDTKNLTTASDIYGLGAILYELLAGHPPFAAENVPALLRKIIEDDPDTASIGDLDLRTICCKCLNKDARQRYASAEALADELDRWLAGEPILARPIAAAERLVRWSRRKPAQALLLALLVFAIGGGLAGISMQWQRAERHAREETTLRVSVQSGQHQVRLNLYAADMSVASQAIERGDLGLARRTLAAQRPRAGEEDLRGFEWRLLWQRCRGGQIATLAGHRQTATCVAFSPDGRWLASGSQDHDVLLWDRASRQLAARFHSRAGAVWSVTFTPDSQRVVVGGGDDIVKIWNVGTHQVERTLPGRLAALSPDGTQIAVALGGPYHGFGAVGSVLLLDFASGRTNLTLRERGGRLAFAPDGRTLAVAGRTKDVRLHDAATGRLRRTLETKDSVFSLAFAPAGDQLATAGWSKEGLIFDLTRSNAPVRLVGHDLNLWSVAFSADGATVVSTSSDQSVRLWDAATGRARGQRRGHGGEVWSVAFAPDGKQFATGGKDAAVLLWHAEPSPPAEVAAPARHLLRPLFAPDSTRALVFQPVGGPAGLRATGTVFQLNPWQNLESLPGAIVCGFAADGRALLSQGSGRPGVDFITMGEPKTIRNVPLDLKPEQWPPAGMLATVDGKFLLVVARDGQASVWNLQTGARVGAMAGPMPPLRCFAISPDGMRVALATEREEPPLLFPIRLLNLADGTERKLTTHTDYADALEFSPDGRTLASASVDGTIKLWETTTGAEIKTLLGHMTMVNGLAFLPEGRTLASVESEHSLKLWHLPTGREVVSWAITNLAGPVTISPDGRTLAYATEDDVAHFLRVPTVEECDADAP